jgi:hypothetical protein
MRPLKYLLEKQRKLSTFIIASSLLLGGLWVPCDSAKYSAYSLAVGGLAGVLVGAHAYQGRKNGQKDADGDT